MTYRDCGEQYEFNRYEFTMGGRHFTSGRGSTINDAKIMAFCNAATFLLSETRRGDDRDLIRGNRDRHRETFEEREMERIHTQVIEWIWNFKVDRSDVINVVRNPYHDDVNQSNSAADGSVKIVYEQFKRVKWTNADGAEFWVAVNVKDPKKIVAYGPLTSDRPDDRWKG